jgi:hypothetical protein
MVRELLSQNQSRNEPIPTRNRQVIRALFLYASIICRGLAAFFRSKNHQAIGHLGIESKSIVLERSDVDVACEPFDRPNPRLGRVLRTDRSIQWCFLFWACLN